MQYCIDSSVDEPIMLLNKRIGAAYTNESEIDYSIPYIDGAEFQRELMELDLMGKRKICIYVCSEGGSVTESLKIVSAILQSKTPVDTYNSGLAASSAFTVFMCGRNRYMYDYARCMMHSISGPDDEIKKQLTDSIKTIVSSNSALSNTVVDYMLSKDTWLTSAECFTNGICTHVLPTKEANKKYLPTASATAMLAYCNLLTDDILQENFKPNSMDIKQITDRLNMAEKSPVEDIADSIGRLIEAQNNAITENTGLKEQLSAAQAKVDELTTKVAESEQAQQEADTTRKAVEAVNEFAAVLGNNPEAIKDYVNLAKIDLDGTIKALKAIPVQSKGKDIKARTNVVKASVQSEMAKIRLRTQA